MSRSRKWGFVAQEAARLGGLGLTAAEIARRLKVNRSSVTRWIKAGKLANDRKPQPPPATPPRRRMNAKRDSPSEWAMRIRAEYSLDASDDQLVTLAERCLVMAQDPALKPSDRVSAGREFRGIVKQLALVGRHGVEIPETPSAPAPAAAAARPMPVRSTTADPRAKLMAVK